MEDITEEMKRAYEIWQDIQNDEETRDAAERRYLELGAIEETKRLEREAGKKEGKVEVTKKMLEEGIDIEVISKVTGLTKEEIEKLR